MPFVFVISLAGTPTLIRTMSLVQAAKQIFQGGEVGTEAEAKIDGEHERGVGVRSARRLWFLRRWCHDASFSTC